jgi:pheromone shutdown protein TraB
MKDILIPFAIVFAGLIAMVIYVLALAVSNLSKQLTKVNEKLLIMIGAKEGDGVARALVAHSKQPSKSLEGISKKDEKKKENPKGITVTMGAN